MTVSETTSTPDPDAFIARWAPSGGQESANYQLFLTELCDLLGLPHPEPAIPDPAIPDPAIPDPAMEETRENAYVFERRVEEQPAADRQAGTGRPAAGARRALRPQHQGATAPRRSCRSSASTCRTRRSATRRRRRPDPRGPRRCGAAVRMPPFTRAPVCPRRLPAPVWRRIRARRACGGLSGKCVTSANNWVSWPPDRCARPDPGGCRPPGLARPARRDARAPRAGDVES